MTSSTSCSEQALPFQEMGEPRASGALRPHLGPQGESLVTAYGHEPRTDLHRNGRAPRERGLFLPPVSAAVLGTGTARGATGRQSEYGNEPPSDLSSPTANLRQCRGNANLFRGGLLGSRAVRDAPGWRRCSSSRRLRSFGCSLRAPLTTPAIRLAPLPPRASVARRLRLPSVLLGRGDEMHRSPAVCGVPPRPGERSAAA
jgi:hypothetical protein